MTEYMAIKDVKPEKLTKAIKSGLIFIYPTDTVYGLGCDATNSKSVKKIRGLKGSNKPFSVIAPSKQWIRENFSIPNDYLAKLPGPYTLIAIPKKQGLVCNEVNLNSSSLGIRIPGHTLTPLIQKARIPFITTSANLTGEPTITRVEEISRVLKEKIDIIIDGGVLGNKPSTVIDVRGVNSIIVRD